MAKPALDQHVFFPRVAYLACLSASQSQEGQQLHLRRRAKATCQPCQKVQLWMICRSLLGNESINHPGLAGLVTVGNLSSRNRPLTTRVLEKPINPWALRPEPGFWPTDLRRPVCPLLGIHVLRSNWEGAKMRCYCVAGFLCVCGVLKAEWTRPFSGG